MGFGLSQVQQYLHGEWPRDERPVLGCKLCGEYRGYNTAVGLKLIEMFRVVYNYHLTGRSCTTPAQLLGLINCPMALEAILFFQPPIIPQARRRTS